MAGLTFKEEGFTKEYLIVFFIFAGVFVSVLTPAHAQDRTLTIAWAEQGRSEDHLQRRPCDLPLDPPRILTE
jgi:hypothetical protein